MYSIDFSTIYGGEDNLLAPCSGYSIRRIKLVSPEVLANRKALRAILHARLKTTIVTVIITSFIFFASQVIWSTIGLDIKIKEFIPKEWIVQGRGLEKPPSRLKTFFTFENLFLVGTTIAVNVVFSNILGYGLQSLFQSIWGAPESPTTFNYDGRIQILVFSRRLLARLFQEN